MREIADITTFTSEKPTVIVVGTFDGAHLGRQKIIKRMVETAHKNELLAAVFTFFPHPCMVIQRNQQLELIHTLAEKKQFLQSLGVDLLIVQPFNGALASLSTEAFVFELLVKHLRARKVIIDYDHRFGKNRTANIDSIHFFGEQHGFLVEGISVQEADEVFVSSTKIRQAPDEGKVKIAEHYLGVPYSFTGKVVHGLKLGRAIGFPTANLQVEAPYKLIPRDGVYVVYSLIEGRGVYGMMSIGKNPTIQGKGASIEVYFLDSNQDLYGQGLTIYLVEYPREERKFSSVSLLKKQTQDDEATAKKAIAL